MWFSNISSNKSFDYQYIAFKSHLFWLTPKHRTRIVFIMNNISTIQQFIAISFISFSDEFNSQFIQSFFSYKRFSSTSKFFDVSEFFEFNEFFSDDWYSNTEIEGPEYIFNDQAEVWRIEMKKQLQHALRIAVLANAKNDEKQLYRKIAMYRNFIKLKYFEALE